MVTYRKSFCYLPIAVTVILNSTPAYANFGLPLVIPSLIGMNLVLCPIVLLENWIVAKRLGVSQDKTMRAMLLGNLTSTILGLPVAWAAYMSLQFFDLWDHIEDRSEFVTNFIYATWYGAWQFDHREQSNWIWLISLLILMVPAYFVSRIIETRVAQKILKDVDRRTLGIAIRDANRASYGLLTMIVLYFLAPWVIAWLD